MSSRSNPIAELMTGPGFPFMFDCGHPVIEFIFIMQLFRPQTHQGHWRTMRKFGCRHICPRRKHCRHGKMFAAGIIALLAAKVHSRRSGPLAAPIKFVVKFVFQMVPFRLHELPEPPGSTQALQNISKMNCCPRRKHGKMCAAGTPAFVAGVLQSRGSGELA